MEKVEKVKQVYKKLGIKLNDDYLEGIMKDEDRVKLLMRIYKDEEIKSMNYIFGKPENNLIFTKLELEAASKIDLFNNKVVEVCRKIWKQEMKEGVANV